jgi:hypothetical protein
VIDEDDGRALQGQLRPCGSEEQSTKAGVRYKHDKEEEGGSLEGLVAHQW